MGTTAAADRRGATHNGHHRACRPLRILARLRGFRRDPLELLNLPLIPSKEAEELASTSIRPVQAVASTTTKMLTKHMHLERRTRRSDGRPTAGQETNNATERRTRKRL